MIVMSVKKRDNGDFIITIPNPLTHAGVSTKVLQKVWVDELHQIPRGDGGGRAGD